MISKAQRRLLLLTATFALSLLSCGREVTGPENGLKYGRSRFGAVSLNPQMPSLLASLQGASSVVPFERVRVVLRRVDGTVSVDTVVNFPSGADSIALSLLVPLPLDAPEAGLPLALTMAYMNAAGDTVFRGGPVQVIAGPVGTGTSPQPVTIPIVYDGVGKDAARVAITPDTGTRVAGTSSTFSAIAFDAQNAPIANAPLLYYTLDSTRASVPVAGSGQVTWLANRGVARIVAALPNGTRADTAFVTVALPASKLVVQSGNAQTGIVSAPLTQPIVLRTLASDDVPVAGVIVTFAVTTGSGALSVVTDTSDAAGVVSTAWTLGAPVGAQSITASSTGLTGSPVTLTATATAGAPARVVITQSGTQAVAGVALAPPVLVAVQDIAGNLVTTFTGAVSLALPTGSAGPINGTTTTNAVGGIATFANVSFDVVGSYNVIARLGTTASDTSDAITVAPGAGARLEFIGQPIGTVAGVPFAPPVTVIARDAKGNTATGFTGNVTLSLFNANGATLGGSLSVAAVNGLATFSGLTVNKVGSNYSLNATSGALTSDTSAVFAISPASPAAIVAISGTAQTGPASVTLPSGIVVEVRDSFGNPTPSAATTFAVILGGGSLSTTSVSTNAAGRATTNWTLGPVVGTQTIRASVAGFPTATVDISATATVGAPASVTFTQAPPTSVVAGVAFTPAVTVAVRDLGGNVVTNYTGPVSVSFANNPSGATLLGTVTVNAVNGVATFSNLSVQIAGTGFALRANTDTLPPAIGAAFNVVNAAASAVVPVAGDGQSAAVGTALTNSLVVRVTDAFGNKITGATVTFAVASGGGSVTPTSVTTNALGEATAAWTLGGTIGTQNVTASITGGVNYQFAATATVGAPTTLAIEGASARTGAAATTIASPLLAKVTDAFGNPVSGRTVTWTVASGAVTLSAPTSITNALGIASVTVTTGVTSGSASVTAASGTISGSPLTFPITITNGPATQLIVGTPPAGGIAGEFLSAFTVTARDANGNVASDYIGNVTIVVDSGPSTTIDGVATVAAAAGTATFSQMTLKTTGQYRLRFASAGLTTAVSAPFIMTAGTAATLQLIDGNAQSDTVGRALALPLRVRVLDSYGNGVPGRAVGWTRIGTGTLAQDTTFTNATGVAQVGFTLGTVSGSTTVQASVNTLVGSPIAFTATGIPGAVAALAVTSRPDTVSAVGAGAPIVVEARDQYANRVTWFTGNINVVVNTAPAASFAGGTTTRTAIAGVATFNDLVYGTAGPWSIGVLSGSFSTSTSLQVVAGAPNSVAKFGGDNQSGVVTLPLPTPLQVRVRDVNNNPVVGDKVVFRVTQGGGTLSSLTALDSAVTNSSGIAQTTWTLGADSTAAQVVEASRPGFATLTFTATPLPFVANRTWTGDVSSDPSNTANWKDGLLPAATDSVLVPAGRPNYPSLANATTYARLTVESGATVTVPTARLSVNGNLSVLGTGSITTPSTGEVAVSGGSIVRGTIGRLVVNAGTYTATASLSVGSLSIANTSRLVVNGQTIQVAGNLDVNASAGLSMTTGAADFVTVNGSATFGNFTSGSLLTGTLRVRGNLTIGQGFQAAATHTINLDGAGYQTITLAVPDTNYNATCTATCLGTFTSNKLNGGLILASNVKALGAITVSGDSLRAVGRKLIGVGGTTLQSGVTDVGTVGYTNSLQVGPVFNADTLVAFGSAGTSLATISAVPTRVTGSYTLGASHSGSVVVSGLLDIDGPNAYIGGDLETTGAGRLRMTNGTDSLSVGEAVFAGTTDSTFLTAGVLEVRLGFRQVGVGITTYAAQSGHRLRFSDANATILFDDESSNTIGSLYVNDGTELTVDGSGLSINGNAVLEGTTASVSSAVADAYVGGGVIDTAGNRWNVWRTRFEGANPALPPAISGNVIFANSVSLSDTLNVGGDVRVTTTSGLLRLNGQRLHSANFMTDAGGRLEMSTSDDSLFVNGNAVFGGGTSILTDGWLEITGGFTQLGTSGAFAADTGHQTTLSGSNSAVITFANPGFGATQSHFGRLVLNQENGTPTTLSSDVFVNGVWETQPRGDAAFVSSGGPRLLATRGASVTDVALLNVRWELMDGAAITGAIADVTFAQLPPEATQFRIARSGGAVNLNDVAFANAPTSGYYLEVQDTAPGNGDTLTVSVSSALPAATGGRTNLIGGAKLNGWDSFAIYTFTGDVSGAFNNPANWDVGAIPTSTSNVIVDNGDGSTLVIDAPVTLKTLTMAPGATRISLTQPLYTTGVLGGFDLVNGTKTCSGAGAFVYNDPSPGPTWLRATLPTCDIVVQQGNVNLFGDFASMRDLRLEGGFFNVKNRVTLSGNLAMTGNSVLLTANPEDSLVVAGNASFRGQQAVLDFGNLLVRGNLDVGGGAEQLQMQGFSHLALGDTSQAGGTRSITIDPGSGMFVDSLTILDGTTTVNGTLAVRRRLTQAVSSTNVLTGSTVVIGDSIGQTVGTMSSGLGGSVLVDRLVVYGAIPTAGVFAPDTTDFVGTAFFDNDGVQKIRAANSSQTSITYQLVRVFADAVMDQVPTGIPFSYTIANALHVLGGQLTIGDSFTQDTVYVSMANADVIVSGPTAKLHMAYPSRVTADSVHFQGGVTSEVANGLLRVRNLVQRNFGAQNQTFLGSTPGIVEFIGTGTVSLEAPLFNPFAGVNVQSNAVTSLGSDLKIAGFLGRSTNGGGLVTLRSTNPAAVTRTVYTAGTEFGEVNDGVVLRGVAVVMEETAPNPTFLFNKVTFQQMDPLSTFLTAAWTGSNTVAFDGINFDSPVTATGRFFSFQSGGAGSQITFVNTTPAVGCMATVCVPTNFAPATEPGATWIGLSSSAWTTPANWSTGTVPTAGTDVVIASGGNFGPAISANTGVRSLTVNAGATLAVGIDDTLSVYNALTVNGTVTGGSLASTLRLVPPIDTFDLSAAGAIQTRLAIGSGIGGYDGVVRLMGRVNLTTSSFNSGLYLNAGLLDLNGKYLNIVGSFRNFGTSRWRMTNPADTIAVQQNFEVRGGSTEGLLTEGEIVISGTNFYQRDDNSTRSFVATGNHSMRFGGGGRSLDVWFETPDSTLSRFANLAIDRTFDQWVNIEYSPVFVTNWTKVSGRISLYNDGRGLDGSNGALIVSGTVSNVVPTHMIDMNERGTVRLLGVNQATCDGLAFNVQYKIANFEPLSCHSLVYGWELQSGATSVTSYGAYAASDNDLWVVGADGKIQRGNGSTWTLQTSNTTDTLFAVHGTSSTDVWAVGADGRIVHWDGSSWTASVQGTQNLNGVFAFSPTSAYAVGDNGTILRWDGSSWTSMSSGTTVKLTGVFSAQYIAEDMLATGDNGVILRFFSGSWQPVPSGVTTDLNATYASAPSGYMVFGDSGTIRRRSNPYNLLFDALSPTTQNLYGAGGNGTTGFAVGANGTILRIMGESFAPQNGLTSANLFGVAVTPNGTAYVVGANGVITKGTLIP